MFTFAATQSRQNSLPSMSCITRHDSSSPSARRSRTRTAPSAIERAIWLPVSLAVLAALITVQMTADH